MSPLRYLLPLLFAVAMSRAVPADSDQAPGHVRAALVSETLTVTAGQPFTVALHFTIAPGWHTYWRDPGAAELPTRLAWTALPAGFTVSDILWPAPQRFTIGGLTSYGYANEAWHLITVTPPKILPADRDLVFRATADWLECADLCVPGTADLSLTLTVSDRATPAPQFAAIQAAKKLVPADREKTPAAFPLMLTLAFLGGLVLNLMPCVFPILGVKILGFINQAGRDKKQIIRHALLFTVGILASFWLLAGALIALRAGGQQLGWGFQLQSPVFVYALTVILLLCALNLGGVFEFTVALTGWPGCRRGEPQNQLAASFLSGALTVALATPCAAPFLATALGSALTLTAGPALLLFTATALGLAAPYLSISVCPKLLGHLPKPGAWMLTLKQLLAFPLYASAAWLVWVLAAQVDAGALLRALLTLTVIACAAWLYGHGQRAGTNRRQCITVACAWLLLLAAFVRGAPFTAAADGDPINWQPWSPELVAQARADGRPVYVDFTARWCATCQTNKALVFGSKAVREKFRELGVVTLSADWTNRAPRVTQELARHGKSAVPFTLLYLPAADEPIELPTLLTPNIVLDALGR
ncbi:MAG: thioredoxin family protein [Verrucomicrobiales bacterium]|jgi:thiol:disulfide interchange protein DsbD|nr:thioredoxin family protein [Verrucomicrobiales bacterium]